MNIENATNVLFRLTSFFPADLLVDIVADKNATADIISNTENKTVFSIVYNDERNNKRIITVTMQAKNKDSDVRFHRYMIDVHYNGNGKVYSSLVSAEAYAELISVLFPCENVASEAQPTLKQTTQEFCKMFNIDLNAPLKARFIASRDGVITIDKIVEVNITDKYYTVGRLRFKRGNETEELLGVTVGKAAKWNRTANESINYLYKLEQYQF